MTDLHERLKQAKRDAGQLELELLRAVQAAERGIARRLPPEASEVAALEQGIDAMRVAAELLRAGWSARAGSEPRAATVECFACARAARDGGVACERHRVREVAP